MSFSKNYAIDADTGLIKRAAAQAALTSTGYVGTQLDLLASTAIDMVAVFNIESIVTAGATGETYELQIIGSNLANRSDCELLASTRIGNAGQIGSAAETRAALAGDSIRLPFRTEKNRTRFRYVDTRLVVAGTAPSIAFNHFYSREV